MIPEALTYSVFYLSHLSAPARLMLLACLHVTQTEDNGDLYVNACGQYLAAMTGMSYRHALRNLIVLEEAGYLTRIPTTGEKDGGYEKKAKRRYRLNAERIDEDEKEIPINQWTGRKER